MGVRMRKLRPATPIPIAARLVPRNLSRSSVFFTRTLEYGTVEYGTLEYVFEWTVSLMFVGRESELHSLERAYAKR